MLFLLYQVKNNLLQDSVNTETQIRGACFPVHV